MFERENRGLAPIVFAAIKLIFRVEHLEGYSKGGHCFAGDSEIVKLISEVNLYEHPTAPQSAGLSCRDGRSHRCGSI
jgi:hypothetical protein